MLIYSNAISMLARAIYWNGIQQKLA